MQACDQCRRPLVPNGQSPSLCTTCLLDKWKGMAALAPSDMVGDIVRWIFDIPDEDEQLQRYQEALYSYRGHPRRAQIQMWVNGICYGASPAVIRRSCNSETEPPRAERKRRKGPGFEFL